jgi:hypothetical protein
VWDEVTPFQGLVFFIKIEARNIVPGFIKHVKLKEKLSILYVI